VKALCCWSEVLLFSNTDEIAQVPKLHLIPSTHFVVYMNAKDSTPSMELRSRDALAPIFADLNKYDATTHFVGQSTILTLTNDWATGEAYCLAHHVSIDGGARRLMIASLRYLDTFVKIDGSWLFSERLLYVDWIDERPRSPQATPSSSRECSAAAARRPRSHS